MRRVLASLAAACALAAVVTTSSTAGIAEAATPIVKFGKFVADPAGNDLPITTAKLNSEYIVLTNTTSKAINLNGYQVRDNGNKHIYRFPKNFTLGAKKSVTLHTGTGRNSSTHLYWGLKNYVWNNTGDTARLLNTRSAVVHQCVYKTVKTGIKSC